MIADAKLTAVAIDAEHLREAVAQPRSGATALFIGTVRDHDSDASGRVVSLEYSSHPDAERVLLEIVSRWDSDDVAIAVQHRVGTLSVGETAIGCAVSSAHRTDAFEVCRALVETVKAELPVWKKQVEADGRAIWVGLGTLAS